MKKKIVLLIGFYFIAFSGYLKAQENSLKLCEDSLVFYFGQLVNNSNDSAKLQINEKISKVLHQNLQNNLSFTYPFDSVKYLSKLTSDDDFLRIYTWNIPLQNGEYKYFGFIQTFNKKKKTVKLFSLTDGSETITNPEKQTLNTNNWYGVLYYELVTTKHKRSTYYTLIGWDGNNLFTNKKVIDNLYFKRDIPYFGAPVFKSEHTTANRIIFEYSMKTSMVLRYDFNSQMIVFDHLSPAKPKFEGQFQYYGPDFSYDGLFFADGYWHLERNIDIKNPENPSLPKDRKINTYENSKEVDPRRLKAPK